MYKVIFFLFCFLGKNVQGYLMEISQTQINKFMKRSNQESASFSSDLLYMVVKSTKWRIVGLPCGQFQGDFSRAKCSSICKQLMESEFATVWNPVQSTCQADKHKIMQ